MVIVLVHVSGLEIDLRRRSYLSAHCHRKVFELDEEERRGAIKVLLVPAGLEVLGKGSQSCSPGKTTRSSPSSTYSDQGCISAVCFEPHALPPHRHGCPGSTHSWYPQRLSYPSVPGTLDRVGVIAVFCS